MVNPIFVDNENIPLVTHLQLFLWTYWQLSLLLYVNLDALSLAILTIKPVITCEFGWGGSPAASDSFPPKPKLVLKTN